MFQAFQIIRQNKDIFALVAVTTIPIHINPLTAGAAYFWIFIFNKPIKYHLLNMLKIKCDINQQYFKTVDLHFVKS